MSKFSYSTNIVQSTVEGTSYKRRDGTREFARTTTTYSTTGYDRSQSHKGSKIVLNFFTIFICILLIVAVSKFLTGSDTELTFTGFLNWLSNMEVQLPFPDAQFVSHSIVESWGILDFMRTVVNIFVTVGDFLLWCFSNMANLLTYITSFVAFLFA